MSPIGIYDIRLTLVWTETVLDTLAEEPSSPSAMSFLGSSEAYARVFETNAAPGGLGRPWDQPVGQYFWRYYLDKQLAAVDGAKAWKSLVPFRSRPPVELKFRNTQGYVGLEYYFYPHGPAVILTAVCREHLDIHSAPSKLFALKNDNEITVQWAPGGPATDLSMEVLASAALDRAREIGYPGAGPGNRQVRPFTITSVVTGSGVNPQVPWFNDKAIRRALEATCTWSLTWKDDPLHLPNEVSFPRSSKPESQVLYGHERGRVVWFPSLFMSAAPRLNSIACYHKNLAQLTMQIESLAGLASETAKMIPAHKAAVTPQHFECARRAVGNLGRLYGAIPATYRSRSSRPHMEQNHLVSDINAVRAWTNMAPLA